MIDPPPLFGRYGTLDTSVMGMMPDAIDFSPLRPGSAALEDQTAASFDAMAVAAPPGTIERRAVIALSLRALKVGAPLTVAAAKDKGGLRIAAELSSFGCTVGETARRHQRICETLRPAEPTGLDAAIAAGALAFDAALGAWTQPGVFSFDKRDAGTSLLVEHLPKLSGRGADLGCGIGILSLAALTNPAVAAITLIDIDRRAVAAASRNVTDPRAVILWGDALAVQAGLAGLDFVVMNPPFHTAGIEDRGLGEGFVRRAAAVLRPGGRLLMTANRHLPYEGILRPLFKRVALTAERDGFKIFEAQK